MKVILKQDIPSLGTSGEIKDVKNGYARNYLLPKGLVMTATARSKKEQEFLEQVASRKVAKRANLATETASKIAGTEVSLTVKTGDDGRMFGSVTTLHIQKELSKAGFASVDRKNIQLSDPIKNLGIYNLKLKLHEGVDSEITVRVQDTEGNTENIVAEAEEPTDSKETEETPESEEVASSDSNETAEATEESASVEENSSSEE